jgi:hypothetical protein
VRPLLVVEVGAVVAFLATAAFALVPRKDAMVAIDVGALATGPAEESWTGIFIGDAHVGYAVDRVASVDGGGSLFEHRGVFSIAAMGNEQEVVTAGTALTDSAGRLIRFDFLLSSPVLLVGRGEMRPGAVHVEFSLGGSEQVVDVPVSEAPTLSLTENNVVVGHDLRPGDTFSQPRFDPVTMTVSTTTITVEAPEMLANNEVAWWLQVDSGGLGVRRLVDSSGRTLREESALGLRTVRMSKEEATKLDKGEAPDLVRLARVPLTGFIDPARPLGPLSLRVTGAEGSRFPDDPPVQRREGEVLTLSTPDPSTWPTLPVAKVDDPDTLPTQSLPATNLEIVEKAREVVGDAPNRAEAARRLHDFVFDYVAKVPTIGIPNGLEVLHSRQGDCNEHTALYVSLARAVGIPSRIAAGLVYSPSLDHHFYYHAWPEVRLGPDESWVPVDPTLNEFPAHATHLKLVNGDLDRQIEVMSVMGKIAVEVVPQAPG